MLSTRPLVLALLTLALGCAPTIGPAAATSPPVVQDDVPAARAAAEAWLALVDAGNYPGSWDAAAALFRNAVPKATWVQQIGAARGAVGANTSRSFQSATPASTLPGAPDGAYVVLQYKAGFAQKASAIETITPMKDPDGVWRVSGYYIK